MDGLVDPLLRRHEPEVDGSEGCQHLTGDPSLLGDLPDCRLLGGLPRFDMPLGQRPRQASATVEAGDEGNLRGRRAHVHDEIDRYLGWPGQAPTYKLGERLWLRARDEAKARQGADFDLKHFHQQVLEMGAMGLDTLAERLAAL